MKNAILIGALSLFVSSMALADVSETPAPAKKVFTAADAIAESEKFDMYCNEGMTKDVEKIEHKFRYSYDTATDPERSVTYFIVSCSAGAYNTSSILLKVDTNYIGGQSVDVLLPVPLAVPHTNKKGNLAGMLAQIVNGGMSYDAKTKSISSFSKGRGLGDMYVLGTYELYETEVILRKYVEDRKEGDGGEKTVFEPKTSIQR